MRQPNPLTGDEREAEQNALLIAENGITDALKILPHDSVWLRCFRDVQTVLRANTGDLGPMGHLADGGQLVEGHAKGLREIPTATPQKIAAERRRHRRES